MLVVITGAGGSVCREHKQHLPCMFHGVLGRSCYSMFSDVAVFSGGLYAVARPEFFLMKKSCPFRTAPVSA